MKNLSNKNICLLYDACEWNARCIALYAEKIDFVDILKNNYQIVYKTYKITQDDDEVWSAIYDLKRTYLDKYIYDMTMHKH